jgi:ABC-type hemin transport system substrate-binding protein
MRHAGQPWIAVALLALSMPAAAARIVTLAPHLAELVCDAGACDQLVAVSDYSDFPGRVTHLPRIGDGFSFSYEGILAQHPDLVLAWDGGTPTATIARLRTLGLRVDTVHVHGLDGIADAIETIGVWLHTEAAARSAATDFRQRLATLRARWRGSTPVRVVYQVGTAPAYTVNADSPISEGIVLCGGVNVFAGLSSIAASVGAEAMLTARPQAVIYGSEDAPAAMRAYWARLPAALPSRLGTLYAVPADLLAQPAPRMLEGIETMCRDLDDARRKLRRSS